MHLLNILSVHYLTVLGRSIVVFGSGAQSGQVLGCANIEPSLVAEEEIEISFPQNGTDPGHVDRCLLNYTHDTIVLHHVHLQNVKYEYNLKKICKLITLRITDVLHL